MSRDAHSQSPTAIALAKAFELPSLAPSKQASGYSEYGSELNDDFDAVGVMLE